MSSTAFLTVPEPRDSPSLSSSEDTSESEMDVGIMVDVAISMPLLPEEENDFLPRRSGQKSRATVHHTLPMSEVELEEPDL
eukprot:g29219.t1